MLHLHKEGQLSRSLQLSTCELTVLWRSLTTERSLSVLSRATDICCGSVNLTFLPRRESEGTFQEQSWGRNGAIMPGTDTLVMRTSYVRIVLWNKETNNIWPWKLRCVLMCHTVLGLAQTALLTDVYCSLD